MPRIYQTGKATKEHSRITVYEGLGNCKVCDYALDYLEAEEGICRECKG